jgi:tetratricopeptide (TPR) repeat protein
MAVLIPSLAVGDIVHLKNGRKAEGKVLSQDAKGLVLDTGARKLTLPMSQVDRVEKSGGQAGAASDDMALSEARGLAQASLLEKSYASYQKVLADPKLAADLRGKAEVESAGVLDQAVNQYRERYGALIKSEDYELCLKRIKQERERLQPGTIPYLTASHMDLEIRGLMAKKALDLQQTVEALRILQAADESAGVSCPVYDAQIGTALVRTQNYEKASRYLMRAFKQRPNDNALRGDTMIALAYSGRADEAMRTYADRPTDFDQSPAWDENHQQALGKALRTQAMKDISKGVRPSTFETYAQGMDLSAIEVPLYDEAVQFYTLAGMTDTAEKMKQARDELRQLCEKSAATSQQMKLQNQARMEQFRSQSRSAAQAASASSASRGGASSSSRRTASGGGATVGRSGGSGST